ncbi:MAG: hypothetical protein NZ703_15300, partial [Gemmataceae bacterium]|nr:hypothetical protein [Gemmataceae bacterium]
GLCWRVWGGALVAAGWYGVCRLQLSPKAAAVATCVLLADPGVMNGQLGYALAKTVVRHWQDKVDAPTPTSASLPQWRIWNPVLSWPWWFAFLGLTARAVCQPTLVRRVAAGISCGLLFHVYFYLWTTAVAGLVLASLLDRRRLDAYLTILGIGVAVGLPALLAAMHFRLTFGSDWLLRTDKFVPLSNRWKELLIPRVSLLLLIVSWIWVWRYRMEYRWLACLATAALLLLNHTLVTGLQIENFHWNYALGPSLSLLVVFMIAHVIQWGPAWLQRNGSGLAIAWAGAVLLVGSALWARAAGGLPENRHIYQVVRAYRSLSGVWPVEQGAAVAGDADFQYLAAVAAGLRPLAGYSALLSPISDAEFDERLALNAYLLG